MATSVAAVALVFVAAAVPGQAALLGMTARRRRRLRPLVPGYERPIPEPPG